MKVTDLAILFAFITLPFILFLRVQTENLDNITYKNVLVNRYLDTATDDASEAMVIRGDGGKVTVSKEKALNAFLCTMYTNFQIADNEIAKSRFLAYIPVIVLLDYDGYWVYSMEEYTNNIGDKELNMVWKPKKPYSYVKDEYVYLYHLDNLIQVYDVSNQVFNEGYPQDLKAQIPVPLLQDDAMFEQIRKTAIVEAIKQDVNTAINLHNTYAQHYGISYRFSVPSISDSDWNKNIEDVGFLAFFQGLPIGLGGERFNSFALGAARIVRKECIYIQQASNGLLYYHQQKCLELTSYDKAYDSREACTLEGAFPCHTCRP